VATPIGASAKFASAGRATAKKVLGLIAMAYGHVYVARTAFGARDAQTVAALREAESYRRPSLVLAYGPCIAHGYNRLGAFMAGEGRFKMVERDAPERYEALLRMAEANARL